ncbi:MAG: dihydrolipoyl dehydrogenase [Acidobacteriia bacterium]|nr:dihydrolipoyl dehydrogenase [Terriglobia bacterium]
MRPASCAGSSRLSSNLSFCLLKVRSDDHVILSGVPTCSGRREGSAAVQQTAGVLPPDEARGTQHDRTKDRWSTSVSETTKSTQVAVVGGGPGGYAAAFRAADMGMQVALIDAEPNPGGVCLYRGCIPSKALLHAAYVLGEARHAANWGITFAPPKVDLDKLRTWKEGVVRKLTGGLGQLAKARSVRYVQGYASLLDARTLQIQRDGADAERLTTEHTILATGSRPATLPNFPKDSERIWDSTDALELQSIPKTMLVVGGGYIGLELGTVYAALGTEVSVVEMMPGLLPGVDRDLVTPLAKRLEKTFRAIMLNTKVAAVKEEKNGLRVRFEGEMAPAEERDYEAILVSVGRKPNSTIPGLDKTRAEVDARGFIKVDGQRRTAEPGVFAIGDVAGEPMLAHKASHEGFTAVEAIAGHKAVFEPQAIPAVVFTDPEIAWCGLTETQAEKENRKIQVVRFPWAASGRATTLDRNDGVTKLVIDPDTERILGVGITGLNAGEMIAEGVLAVEMGAKAADLALSIHPHPTLSETVMEAAEIFFGQSTHLYRPKKK